MKWNPEKLKNHKGFTGKQHSSEYLQKYMYGENNIAKKAEVRIKISNARKGMKFTEEHIEKMRQAKLGKKNSEEHNRNIADAQRGERSHFWKGGLTKLPNYKAFLEGRRRSRKTNNGGSHTLAEWEALKMKYRYMCLCCKKTEPEVVLSEDHIVPISKGGNDDISNIQPLCRSCNSKKNAKIINYLTAKPA